MEKRNISMLRFLGLMIAVCVLAGSVRGQSMRDSTGTVAFTENLSTSPVSQDSNPPITLELDQVPLKEALKRIAGQAKAGLYYNATLLPEKIVSLHLKAVPLGTALRKVLEGTMLQVVTSARNITLRPKSTTDQGQAPLARVQESITGTVTDGSTGNTLPGVNIKVKGTTTGTSTDGDGQYELAVESLQDTLVFSFVGYRTQEVPINGRTEINIEMQSQAITGEEILVTAFQQRREERSLGTSIGTVSSEEVAGTNDLNISKALSGRIAGVQVSSASSGPGGSSRIIIRGYSSVAGNNQPLYIVDGVPIDNSNRKSAQRFGGYDRGDGIQDINPKDIESISVLKGPNAAALYGQRGANGVILITTKSGENREGIGVNLSSSVTFGRPWMLPDFQNKFGEGTQGHHRFYNDGNGNIISRKDWITAGKPENYIPQVTTINNGVEGPISWGPKLDGAQVYTYDGKLRTFSPQPNNIKDVYNTEKVFKNSFSLSGGDDSTTYRLSYANTNSSGMFPGNRMKKHNFSLKGSHQFNERFSANARVNFVIRDVDNRPGVAANNESNISFSSIMMPRNVRNSSMQKYELTQEDLNNPNAFHGYSDNERKVGYSRLWTNGTFTENPYWSVNNVAADDNRNRIIGTTSLQYDFADWISLSAQGGVDYHTDQYLSNNSIGTRRTKTGTFSESIGRFSEVNIQSIASMEKSLSNDIILTANIGGHYLWHYFRLTGQNGTRYSIPDLHTIGNTEVQSYDFNMLEYKTLSLLAYGGVNFKNEWFINWTARNDWSSTLPVDDNSFFYPSVNTNLVWTDVLNLDSEVLSYGSVRASWAQAGSSADPYQLNGTYSLSNYSQAGQPLASYTNIIPLQALKNELTTSIEFGADFRFFQNRLKANATYYHAVTKNQILNVAVPVSSGYTNKVVNAGKIRNQGIEFSISGTPVQTSKLSWDIDFNFSANRNKVVSLVEGVSRYQLGDIRNAIVFADPGKPYGEIYAPNGRWLRDNDGNRLIDPSGLPIREDGLFPIANAMPDWGGGVSTTVNFMGFNFNAVVDISQGGQVVSQSNILGIIQGTTKRSLEGRDGTYIAKGMAATQNADGNWVSTGNQNKVQVSAQDYWDRVVPSNATAIAEPFINDLSYIALRKMSIGYSFPHLIKKISNLRSLRLSIVGNNLFYFERHTDGFSPESSHFNVGSSSLGLELYSFPMARTIGFNINVGF